MVVSRRTFSHLKRPLSAIMVGQVACSLGDWWPYNWNITGIEGIFGYPIHVAAMSSIADAWDWNRVVDGTLLWANVFDLAR